MRALQSASCQPKQNRKGIKSKGEIGKFNNLNHVIFVFTTITLQDFPLANNLKLSQLTPLITKHKLMKKKDQRNGTRRSVVYRDLRRR